MTVEDQIAALSGAKDETERKLRDQLQKLQFAAMQSAQSALQNQQRNPVHDSLRDQIRALGAEPCA